MTKQTIKRIHTVYAILVTLLVLAVGIALIASCIQIYKSGDRPFSRESVGEAFSKIALLVYLCLAFILGGIVLSLALPLEKEKNKGVLDTGAAIARLKKKIDPARCPTLVEKMQKERTRRRVLFIVSIVLYVVFSSLACVYVLNQNNFPALDANGEIAKATLILFAALLVPFLFSLVTVYLNKKSLAKELSYAKEGVAASAGTPKDTLDASVPEPSFFKLHEKKLLLITRCVVIALGLTLLVAGLINGGAGDVVQKAIKICTECIGLG